MPITHCRKHGIWILPDEVYERLIFPHGALVVPCLLDIADPDDRLIVVNSFSKSWRMTGWRIGWLTMPAALKQNLATFVEYNTSCVADFVQRGALAAVSDPRGEAAIAELKAGLEHSRDLLLNSLANIGGIDVPVADAMAPCMRFSASTATPTAWRWRCNWVERVGLGLAPGNAFGDEGEGWLRWCYAASPIKIAMASQGCAASSRLEPPRGRVFAITYTNSSKT